MFEGSGCLGFITAAESHGGVVHGFVREELPLVCQKCNPAVTRRDPALRGKLLRQKCVSVGAPSCPASLPLSSSLCVSFSLYFAHYLYLSTPPSSLFIPPYTVHRPITQDLSLLSAPPCSCLPPHSSLPSPSFTVNSIHASVSVKNPPPPPPSHPLAIEGFFYPVKEPRLR